MNLPTVVGPVGGEGSRPPSLLERAAASVFRGVASVGTSISLVRKAWETGAGLSGALASASSRWIRIWDNYAGEWQQDIETRTDTVLTFGAVSTCLRLITTDIGKLRLVLKQQNANGIWRELPADQQSPFLQVLRKPNRYQTRIKFIELWLTSKLIKGNAYILKIRDGRGVVRELRVINPNVCLPMVSESGEVFYQVIPGDQLATPSLDQNIYIPASEIIHDVHVTPEHALIGVSPIGACGLAATQGINIQKNSTKFFGNQSRAGIVLTSAGKISDETAARLKASWEANYGGDNFGRTAVLGDGLEPKPFTIPAADAQLIEQLNWTAIDVCRCFGVPAYKIGVGAMPSHNNIEQLDQAYYSQTLQEMIENIELLLTEGLEVENMGYAVSMDTNQLLRLDKASRYKAHRDAIAGGWKAPNEVRIEENLDPVEGGDTPYLQQQNFSLEALGKRDASADPFANAGTGGGGGAAGDAAASDATKPDSDEPAGPASPDQQNAALIDFVAERLKRSSIARLRARRPPPVPAGAIPFHRSR